MGLAPKALDELSVFDVVLPEDLQREVAAEDPVVGQEDLGHPPSAQKARKNVAVAQDVGWHELAYPPICLAVSLHLDGLSNRIIHTRHILRLGYC